MNGLGDRRRQADSSVGRRGVLALGLAAPAALATPALAQTRTLIRVGLSSPNRGLAGLAERFARRLEGVSGGAMRVEVGGVATLADLGQRVDAVVGHGDDWFDIDPAFSLFSDVPFGLSPREFEAWVLQGLGGWVWDQIGAEHGLKPVLLGDFGPRPVAWTKAPLTTLDQLTGMSAQSSAFGAVVLSALGATVTADEDADWMDSGGLAVDLAAGLPSRYSHLITPSALKPQSAVTLAFSDGFWSGRTVQEQTLINAAATAEADAVASGGIRSEAEAYGRIRAGSTTLSRLLPDLFTALAETSLEVIEAEVTARSKWPGVWEEYRLYLKDVTEWTFIGESAFSVARAKAMGLDI